MTLGLENKKKKKREQRNSLKLKIGKKKFPHHLRERRLLNDSESGNAFFFPLAMTSREARNYKKVAAVVREKNKEKRTEEESIREF